ncbi:MAG: hypothetical protein IJL87_02180, partial [Clostridia bacterium]|nr:hypothetical protein [Clostridia bacterium]
WVQLKCAQLSSQGVRLKDMPGEWMTVPDDEQMKNSIIAVKAVFACNRLLDMHKIEEAAQLITRIVSDDDYAVCGLHRGMLIGDLVYCSDMLGKSTPRELTQDKMYITVSKKMKQFLSVIRTNYAHALLWEKNEQKADKILEEFEKITKNYPYSSDIESERELIALAKEKTNT